MIRTIIVLYYLCKHFFVNCTVYFITVLLLHI
ncbi:hypothetical protein WI0192307A01_CDS0026 [Salmonella phage VT223]|uniref:Uncharacterized protein n=2 Tax=unclassified bacterial viruses TaxID=12333 RepID=A0AB39C5D4_9VIRU